MTEQDIRAFMRTRLLHRVDTSVVGDTTPAEAVRRADGILDGYLEHGRPRLIIGTFRYGSRTAMGTKFDTIGDAIRRLERYLRQGNQEDLVDAANLCAVELADPSSHPAPHFSSTDDGEHVATLSEAPHET